MAESSKKAPSKTSSKRSAACNKTGPTKTSPAKFIASVEHEVRRADAKRLLVWFEDVTSLKPKMWGPSIVGFGRYRYKYDSGREGEFFLTGFSPRKSALTVYVMPGYRFDDMADKLARLGKHKTGRSCLYINRLTDVDMDVLREIVLDGVAHMRKTHETWDE